MDIGKSMWQIMIPCNFNSGKPVRTRHHKEWDKRVNKITGGLTILPPSKGMWVDKDTNDLYKERMIPVNIIATESQMQKIADITIQHYRQLAVMYFKISDSAFIRYAKE
jgi:hypothetical protein